jgi:hypothetical protein
MKYIEIDYHFIPEATDQLEVRFISTKDQVVDAFPKPLPGPALVFSRG